MVSRPGGATMRVQVLPKPSRYAEDGTGGSKAMDPGARKSAAREGWTLSISTMGVGWGQSYAIS